VFIFQKFISLLHNCVKLGDFTDDVTKHVNESQELLTF